MMFIIKLNSIYSNLAKNSSTCIRNAECCRPNLRVNAEAIQFCTWKTADTLNHLNANPEDKYFGDCAKCIGTQPSRARAAAATVGCGRQMGRWRGRGERWRHHTMNGEMQAPGQRFGVRDNRLSLTFSVRDLVVSNNKSVCLSRCAPNTMTFDGRDLEWEFSSAKMHYQHRAVPCGPGFRVSLDPLPLKVRPLLNAWYFLDSCGIHIWKTKITVNVKAGQNLCYNPICCIKEEISHKKELYYITHELCMVQFWDRVFFSQS